MNWTPGPLNSILISTENAVPNNPENNAKIKYKVPLEMEPASRSRSPQRSVRASHPAHGSTVDQPAWRFFMIYQMASFGLSHVRYYPFDSIRWWWIWHSACIRAKLDSVPLLPPLLLGVTWWILVDPSYAKSPCSLRSDSPHTLHFPFCLTNNLVFVVWFISILLMLILVLNSISLS